MKEWRLNVQLKCQVGSKDCEVSNGTNFGGVLRLPRHSNEETVRSPECIPHLLMKHFMDFLWESSWIFHELFINTYGFVVSNRLFTEGHVLQRDTHKLNRHQCTVIQLKTCCCPHFLVMATSRVRYGPLNYWFIIFLFLARCTCFAPRILFVSPREESIICNEHIT